MEIHSVRPIKKCTSFSSSKTWCRISRKLIRIWRWWWLLAALMIKLVNKVWISLLSKNQSINNQFTLISYRLSKIIKFIVHLFNCKIKRLNIHNLQKYKMYQTAVRGWGWSWSDLLYTFIWSTTIVTILINNLVVFFVKAQLFLKNQSVNINRHA
jgi:hypothetical protein